MDKTSVILFVLLVIMVVVSIVYGATSDTFDASINISNNLPAVFNVTAPSTTNPVDGATVTVGSFTIQVEDINGIADINLSSLTIALNQTGETDRTNSTLTDSCIGVENTSATESSFSCDVTMFYYDSTGTWGVNVTIADNSAAEGSNTSVTYDYGTLSAIQVPETIITWDEPIQAGDEDKVSAAPVSVNNTGNQDFGAINATVFDLMGQADANYSLYNFSGNFSTDCDATALLHNTSTNITPLGGAALTHGLDSNISVYFCLESVPENMTSQTYNTSAIDDTAPSSWILDILS